MDDWCEGLVMFLSHRIVTRALLSNSAPVSVWFPLPSEEYSDCYFAPSSAAAQPKLIELNYTDFPDWLLSISFLTFDIHNSYYNTEKLKRSIENIMRQGPLIVPWLGCSNKNCECIEKIIIPNCRIRKSRPNNGNQRIEETNYYDDRLFSFTFASRLEAYLHKVNFSPKLYIYIYITLKLFWSQQ